METWSGGTFWAFYAFGQRTGTNGERQQLCNGKRRGKAGLNERKSKERKEDSIIQNNGKQNYVKTCYFKIRWELFLNWFPVRWVLQKDFTMVFYTSATEGEHTKQGCGPGLWYIEVTRRLERNIMSLLTHDAVLCSASIETMRKPQQQHQ